MIKLNFKSSDGKNSVLVLSKVTQNIFLPGFVQFSFFLRFNSSIRFLYNFLNFEIFFSLLVLIQFSWKIRFFSVFRSCWLRFFPLLIKIIWIKGIRQLLISQLILKGCECWTCFFGFAKQKAPLKRGYKFINYLNH